MTKAKSLADGNSLDNEDIPVKPICGVIMPISRTANQSAEHWISVQALLHRCINKSGFHPVNAWKDTANDRVSERIIGNIFKFPIFVVDISDLNPNVMLELGLRLASKMPTVVVVNEGGEVPFDIRDFHYETYPSDLNILGMESFFERLEEAIKEKYEASKRPGYTPFLGDVVIEVISPEVEQVTASQAILGKLDSMSARLSRLEQRPTRMSNSAFSGFSYDPTRDAPEPNVNLFVPAGSFDRVVEYLSANNIQYRLKSVSQSEVVITLVYPRRPDVMRVLALDMQGIDQTIKIN